MFFGLVLTVLRFAANQWLVYGGVGGDHLAVASIEKRYPVLNHPSDQCRFLFNAHPLHEGRLGNERIHIADPVLKEFQNVVAQYWLGITGGQSFTVTIVEGDF